VGAEIGQLYRERSRKREKEAEKEQPSEA
jgi:hypothetical protein